MEPWISNTNWVKRYFLLWLKWYLPVACYCVCCTTISFTLPPIWDAMHSNCQPKYGESHTRIHIYTNLIIVIILHRLPFDWQTPFGYFIAIAMQYVMVLYMLMLGAFFISLAVGSYVYMVAANKCTKCSLSSINRNAITDHANQNGLLEQFIELIRFQSAEKELRSFPF